MDTTTEPLWGLEKRFWLEGAPVYEAHLHRDAVVLAYLASAVREGEGQYQCLSTYARNGAGWLMVSHQQTPEAP